MSEERQETTEALEPKEVVIKGENTYKYYIQIKDNMFIQVKNKDSTVQGIISLFKIRTQINEFFDYNIIEIFEEINDLKDNNFQIINNIFSIKFKILKRERKIFINLVDINNNAQNRLQSDLNEFIKKKKEEIESAENKFRGLNQNIDIKEIKGPIRELDYHKDYVYCSTVLKDGRFATSSLDHSIIIYNNKTFKPDITINEHSSHVFCIIQLSCGLLASCSDDKTIILYNINGKKFTVMQTLNAHTDSVFHIIELKNKKLVSCSCDETINIYNIYDNNKYVKDYSIKTNGSNGPIIQTKNNEICYQESNNTLCFYDLIEKNVIKKINNINLRSYIFKCMIIIEKDLLVLGGYNQLYIININSYKLIEPINSHGSGYITCSLLLDENILLTGDNNGGLIQWKIENDNLRRISIKEKSHNCKINTLLKIENDFILSGGDDEIIKIWNWKN